MTQDDIQTVSTTYDEQGRVLVESIDYADPNEFDMTTTHIYAGSFLISVYVEGSDGTSYYLLEPSYDSNGIVESVIEYDEEGNTISVTEYDVNPITDIVR